MQDCSKYLKTFNHPFFYLLIIIILSSCGAQKKSRKIKKAPIEHKTNVNSSNKEAEKNNQIKSKYAGLLGVSADKINNLKLYSLIDDWYAVPYKYGGNTKEGIDCSNFISLIYQEIYNLPFSGPSEQMQKLANPVEAPEFKEGDLIFFKINKEKVSHIGLYLQNNKFVHATTKKGIMINDLKEVYYSTYFHSAGRVLK